MTTIAYKNGVMACDGLILQGDTIIANDINKIIVKSISGSYNAGTGSFSKPEFKKCYIGIAGNVGDMENIKRKKIKSPEDLLNLDISSSTTLLVVFYNGVNMVEIYIVTGDNKVTFINHENVYEGKTFIAIGSGKEAALGAMHSGEHVSADMAIEIAAKIDIATGGLIRSYNIDRNY